MVLPDRNEPKGSVPTATVSARPWRATVRVCFLLREGRSFGGSDVSVVPGGRTALPSARAPQLTLPDGFTPLVELRAHSAVGADAIRRVVPQP